jgi:hypothetical protein
MRMINYLVITVIFLFVVSTSSAQDACIACHTSSTPSIVEDWKKSEHSENGVNCYTCHQVKEGDYSEDHHGYVITPVVSPKKCAMCHEYEYVTQMKSKHAFAAINGPLKPWYNEMQTQGLNPLDSRVAKDNPPEEYIKKLITPLYPASGIMEKAGLFDAGINHANQFLGCLECHGSYVYYDGEKLQGWPNLGVGRINPDGSIGACSSCHSAHQFSIKEARMPETCGKCHLGYDHPQIEIYESSYHGVRYEADGENWNWEAQPWKAGIDFSAPTCVACHMGEIALPSGKVVVEGTHDVGSRLKWEIQAKFIMYQSSNSNLAAGGFKPDKELGEENRERMTKVCQLCHSPDWVDGYFDKYELVLEDYNITANYTYSLLQQIYAEGLADKSNPIDEFPEFMWYYIWHHEGRRWRMGASMMGPDYTHWEGAVDTVMDKLGRMIDWYETKKELKGGKNVGLEASRAEGGFESLKITGENVESLANGQKQSQLNFLNLGMGIVAAVFGLTSVALVRKFKK